MKSNSASNKRPQGAQLTRNLWFKGLGRFPNKQETLRSAGAEMSVFRIWRAISIACDFCRSKVLWPHMHCLRLVRSVKTGCFHCLYNSSKQCICIYKCEKPSIPLSRNEWFFCLLRCCPKPRLTQSFGLRLCDLQSLLFLPKQNLFSKIFSN